MTLTFAEVNGKMSKVAEATKNGTRTTVEGAALKVKATIAAGAPARLRNVGKNGANLGIRYTIRGEGSGVSASVRATGPWPIIESDIGAHVITGKKAGRGAGSRKKRAAAVNRLNLLGIGGIKSSPIVIPGIGVRAYAHHPGTKGQHPWAKGVARAEPIAAREMSTRMANIVKAAF